METPQAPPPKKTHRPHQGRIHRRKERVKRPPPPLERIQKAEAVLVSLHRFRLLSSAQIARIHFGASQNHRYRRASRGAMQKAANEACLMHLRDLGLVALKPIVVRPAEGDWQRREVNVLTEEGEKAVRRLYRQMQQPFRVRSGGYVQRLSLTKLNELYWIVDAAVAVVEALQEYGGRVVEWYDTFDTSGKRNSHHKEMRFDPVAPDGCLEMELEGRRYVFFLESDRDTEAATGKGANTWENKMVRYAKYFRDRYLKLGHEIPQPLVLTVTTDETRLESIRKATAGLRLKDVYWFATESQTTIPTDPTKEFPDPQIPVWRTAGGAGPLALLQHTARPEAA